MPRKETEEVLARSWQDFANDAMEKRERHGKKERRFDKTQGEIGAKAAWSGSDMRKKRERDRQGFNAMLK